MLLGIWLQVQIPAYIERIIFINIQNIKDNFKYFYINFGVLYRKIFKTIKTAGKRIKLEPTSRDKMLKQLDTRLKAFCMQPKHKCEQFSINSCIVVIIELKKE